MPYEVFPYSSFSYEKYKNIEEQLLIVYDKKPEMLNTCKLIDFNSFKFQTLLNEIPQSIEHKVVFLIKKFTDEFIYVFFRHSYCSVELYSDDSQDKLQGIAKTNNITCLYYAKHDFSFNYLFFIPEDVMTAFSFFVSFNFMFVHLYYLPSNKPENTNIFVSCNKNVVNTLQGFRTTESALKSLTTCIVYHFDQSYNYTEFASVIFLLPESQFNIPAEQNITEEMFMCLLEQSKNSTNTFLSTNSTEHAQNRALVDRLLTFENFLMYVNTLRSKAYENTIEECGKRVYEMNVTEHHIAMRIDEVTIEELKIPLEFAKQVMYQILNNIKTAGEDFGLYIKTFLPEFTYVKGGYYTQEWFVKIQVPEMPELSVEGECFIKKNDAANDAAVRFLRHLVEQKLLDNHLKVNGEVLKRLPSVQKLLVRVYGTHDTKQIAELRKNFTVKNSSLHRNEQIIHRNGVTKIVSDTKAGTEDLFKKKHIIELGKLENEGKEENAKETTALCSFSMEGSEISKMELRYRKIPECLTVPTNRMALYTFSNSNTGVLCGDCPIETCTLISEVNQRVQVTYTPPRVFSEEELRVLKFYQLIFFKMQNQTVVSQKQVFRFFYFVVPLDEQRQIDWLYLHRIYEDFIQNSVYADFSPEGDVQQKDIKSNLVWCPFTKEFIVFHSVLDRRIEETLEGTTFVDFYQRRYNVELSLRTGYVLFKAHLCAEVASVVRKDFNQFYNKLKIEHSESPFAEEVRFSICTVERRTGVGSSAREPRDTLDLPDFLADPMASDSEIFLVYSGECCFKTPIKKSILLELELFKRNYRLLDDVFVAAELKRAFSLFVSIPQLVTCMSHSRDNRFDNYERLEFLGDCVLKFLTTSYLYLSEYPLERIVSFKDTVICNANLFRCCIDSGLYRYLKTCPFNPKMIQGSSICFGTRLSAYFHMNSMQYANNYAHFMCKVSDPDASHVKVYADMMEALIGAVFLDAGISDAYSFICKLGVLREETCPDPLLSENFFSNVLEQENKQLLQLKRDSNTGALSNERLQTANTQVLPNFKFKITNKTSLFLNLSMHYFQFNGLITQEEIARVEEAIGYRFSNPGNLERAMVHPSFSNILGFEDFQCLELIGDCSLDLFVSRLLFQNQTLSTPLLLHSAKKAYVNNNSLRALFFRFGFSESTKSQINNCPSSKAYSDIIEAIIGAVMVDVQWDFSAFIDAMNVKMKFMLEECRSPFTLD